MALGLAPCVSSVLFSLGLDGCLEPGGFGAYCSISRQVSSVKYKGCAIIAASGTAAIIAAARTGVRGVCNRASWLGKVKGVVDGWGGGAICDVGAEVFVGLPPASFLFHHPVL